MLFMKGVLIFVDFYCNIKNVGSKGGIFASSRYTIPGIAGIKKGTQNKFASLILNRSNYLLSPTVASVVPSALEGLTTVFGMGTGVSPPARSLRKFSNKFNKLLLVRLKK